MIFGLIAYFLSESIKTIIPYVLSFSAASFLYLLPLAELIPEMHKKSTLKDSVTQISFILIGVFDNLFKSVFKIIKWKKSNLALLFATATVLVSAVNASEHCNNEGAFEMRNDDIELAAFTTCGGCPWEEILSTLPRK